MSTVWFGDHRVMYLEIGEKIQPPEPVNHDMHEQHAFLGYDWKLVRPGYPAIRRSDAGADSAAESVLFGKTIESLRFSDSRELVLSFDGGTVLEPLSSPGEGPDWDLREGLGPP